MSEAQHLAEALEGLLSDAKCGWFTPFSVSTDLLTARKAAEVPAPGANTVWAVANDIALWREAFPPRLRGKPVDRQAAAENGSPDSPQADGERAWEHDRERTLALNRELAQAVAGLTDEDLSSPSRRAAPSAAGCFRYPRAQQLSHLRDCLDAADARPLAATQLMGSSQRFPRLGGAVRVGGRAQASHSGPWLVLAPAESGIRRAGPAVHFGTDPGRAAAPCDACG